MTSDRLYALGIELMDRAVADAGAAERIRTSHAFQYRDGLVIAFLAAVPLRSRTLAALRVGRHLIKVGIFGSSTYLLQIPRPDGHLTIQFRRSCPRASIFTCSNSAFVSQVLISTPASGHQIRADQCVLTPFIKLCADELKKPLALSVNLHRFRQAAASFWSSYDPVNVRGAKDLLGHASFATTEKHYVMAQSRLAGRALARAIEPWTSRNHRK